MPKPNKSSASSGTRKKNARKAAKGQDEPDVPAVLKAKKGKKGAKPEPRVKAYIPPVKPSAPRPDPLDAVGLAYQLPADLVVVLRMLGKKDAVTKVKGLDELQIGWFEKATQGSIAADDIAATLEVMLPVWYHHYPSLALHSSRRVRSAAAQLHSTIWSIPALQKSILFFLREMAEVAQLEELVGAWAMSAFDMEPLVSTKARRSWLNFVKTVGPNTNIWEMSVVMFVQHTIMSPETVHSILNPPAAQQVIQPNRTQRGGRGGRQPPASRPKPTDEATKADPEEELAGDRNARYRIGAMGLLKWLIDTLSPPTVETTTTEAKEEHQTTPSPSAHLLNMLSDGLLWSCLFPASSPPWCSPELLSPKSPAFGHGQPLLRRTTWSILSSIVRKWKDHLQDVIQTLSSATLRSAWLEMDTSVQAMMWEPLLLFLTNFPQSWLIEASDNNTAHLSNVDDANDSDPSDDDEPGIEATEAGGSRSTASSKAYGEFLDFLRLGCNGNPSQGYPIVLLTLSTLPPEIFPLEKLTVTSFFASMWSAVDARVFNALETTAASGSLVSSVLECLVFLVKHISKQAKESGNEGEQALLTLAHDIIQEQFSELVNALTSSKVTAKDDVLGDALAKMLMRLEDVNEDGFVTAAWTPLATLISSATEVPLDSSQRESSAMKGVSLLGELHSHMAPERHLLRDRVATIAQNILSHSSITILDTTLDVTRRDASANLLASLLSVFSSPVRTAGPLRDNVDTLFSQILENALWRLSPDVAANLLSIYLRTIEEPHAIDTTWTRVLSSLAELKNSSTFLNVILSQSLPSNLPIPDAQLDSVLSSLVETSLRGDDAAKQLLTKLLNRYEHFVSKLSAEGAVDHIVSTCCKNIHNVFVNHQSDVQALSSCIAAIEALIQAKSPLVARDQVVVELLPSLFVLAYIASLLDDETGMLEGAISTARRIVTISRDALLSDHNHAVQQAVFKEVGSLVLDITARIRASLIVDALSSREFSTSLKYKTYGPDDVLPPRADFESLFSLISTGYIDTPTSLFDPRFREPQPVSVKYDLEGFSAYARIATALLDLLKSDLQTSSQHVWAVPHLVLLEVASEDYLMDPGLHSRALFSRDVPQQDIQQIQQDARAVLTFMFGTLMNEATDGWHGSLCIRLKSGQISDDSPEGLVSTLFSRSMGNEVVGVKDVRVFRRVLQLLLKSGDSSSKDGEQWLLLADSVRQRAPQTSLSIVLVVSQLGLESPRLGRYRNEIASRLAGVPPSKAQSEGGRLLRELLAAAPSPDSDAALLPQQRVIFLLQTLQKWLASDEDLDEENDSLLAYLFTEVAPIVQSMSGAHWDFIFDVMESNLESSSLNDKDSFVTMSRTLTLATKIDEIAQSNKGFKAIWKEREKGVLDLIGQRVVETGLSASHNALRCHVQQQLYEVAADLNVSIAEEEGFISLSEALKDSSTDLQISAFNLLAPLVTKRSERLVVEAAVETDEEVKFELPSPVLDLLKGADSEHTASSLLLAWTLIFDAFENVSIKIKNSYVEQLRTSRLVEKSFLPSIFTALGIGSSQKPFPIDMWAVDEFYIDLLDDSLETRFQVFAAHLYFRSLIAIPSLIREGVQDHHDKNLFHALSIYTSRSFTPVLVSREVARLKAPDAEDLVDEQLTIKVSASKSTSTTQVSATYVVDEQPMEISITFPADFPLHNISVKDVQKLGISENKWRAWLFGVQLVAQQTGSLVDALSVWKRNVALHFEGVQECAICYSVINVTDRSLPKKPCNTCNNQFHASCLFRWFNTSNNSTCPLCRSNIL